MWDDGMMCLNVSVCLLSDISRHEKHIKNTYTRRRKRERESCTNRRTIRIALRFPCGEVGNTKQKMADGHGASRWGER